MNIKQLHQNFKMPTRGTDHAGGYDIYMPEKGTLMPGATYGQMVPLGFSAEVPVGYVALLLPRSGAGAKHGVSLNNTVGVIDADYRGEVLIGLHNLGKDVIEIKAGDRVCQMLVHAYMGDSETVEVLPEDVDRGTAGIGSTGL